MVLVALLGLALIWVACDSEDDDYDGGVEPESQAPPLPPEGSLLMEFDDFDTTDQFVKNTTPLVAAATIQNWFYSAATAGAWQFVITFTMAVPVASFVAAFDAEPVYDGDGWWVWSYDFTAQSADYSADLKGRIVADSVEWEMYISKQGVYEDFLWYTGTHDLFATGGQWNLKHNHSNPEPFLQVDWSRDTVTSTGELKYTNIISGSVDFGGYIHYGSTSGADYDRFYTIYGPSTPKTTEIEWNHSTKAGRVRDEHHFGDSDWHCWDEDLQDMDCP
jgi:hypothetical protein